MTDWPAHWFDKRHAEVARSITREFFGDPAPGRSALAGFKPPGDDYLDPSGMGVGHSLKRSMAGGKWKEASKTTKGGRADQPDRVRHYTKRGPQSKWGRRGI